MHGGSSGLPHYSHRGLSQMSMVGGWPAEHHWRQESPELQLLFAPRHRGEVEHGYPFLNTASLALWLRRPLRERKIPSSNPACAEIFPGSSHTIDLNIGTPVATLSGAWRYRVSAGTGWPGVSILWLGETESLVCSFYLSAAARRIVWADPSLRHTSMLLGH